MSPIYYVKNTLQIPRRVCLLCLAPRIFVFMFCFLACLPFCCLCAFVIFLISYIQYNRVRFCITQLRLGLWYVMHTAACWTGCYSLSVTLSRWSLSACCLALHSPAAVLRCRQRQQRPRRFRQQRTPTSRHTWEETQTHHQLDVVLHYWLSSSPPSSPSHGCRCRYSIG